MKILKRIFFGFTLLLIIFVMWVIHPDVAVDELKPKYAPSPSAFVSIQGMDVHFRDEGEGMPILLIHGTSSSLHTWEGWRDMLVGDFRIIRLDMPSYGLTGASPSGPYGLTQYSDFLDEFLAYLQVDSIYMAGNSLGGAITWHYAATRPDKVKKIILIDPAGASSGSGRKNTPAIFKLAANPFLSKILRFVTPKSLIAKNLREVYYDDSKVTRSLIQRHYDLVLREGNRQAFIDRIQMKGESVSHLIDEVKCPTLIQWGTYDSWIPAAHAEIFRSRIANSEVIYYEAGHVPMEEIPELTAADARKFLLSE